MSRRLRRGTVGRARRFVGAVLAIAALPTVAQIGPLTNQNLFFDQAANARRGNYLEADTGFVYTDDASRVEGGSGDTLALLGLVADAQRRGTRFDYRLSSDLAVAKYLHSDYQTQPFGYLDGAGEVWFVPGFFSWTGRETYAQTVIEPFAAVTPDNLEGLNYATTGPRITLRPTLRTTITLDGTYSYINSSSKSPLYVNLDNHRYGGDATVKRAFSNTSSIYVTGSTEKVYFRDQIDNTDFTLRQELAGYRLEDARTLLDLAGGYAQVHVLGLVTVPTLRGPRQVAQAQTPGGVIWRLDLSRQTSPASRLSFTALKQVTDAANLFRLNIDQPVASTAADRITAGDSLSDRELGATWRFLASRTWVVLGYLDTREHYTIHPTSDRTVRAATALIGRQLNPELSADVGAEYLHQALAMVGASNTINVVTNVRWKLSSHIGLRFLYAHSALTPHGYTENQVGVLASFAVVPSAQASAEPSAEGVPPTPTSRMLRGLPSARPQ